MNETKKILTQEDLQDILDRDKVYERIDTLRTRIPKLDYTKCGVDEDTRETINKLISKVEDLATLIITI